MLNYLKRFAMEIVPSVAATIIGAYIVNHYIAAKPAHDVPAATVASTAKPKAAPKAAETKAAETKAAETKAAETKADPKSETDGAKASGEGRSDEQTDVAGIPASGVKAKGISEKALLERNAAAEKAVVIEKPAEKAAPAPTETTASLPVEPRRQSQPSRLKPAVPSVVAVAPAETASEERRDANDLARAAIERLRAGGSHEPARGESPRAAAAPSVVKPLPPPIMVAAPPETSEARPPYASSARADDALRPTPPAEIPTARPPLDLRAEMAVSAQRERTSVAEDMLTAAKSMFHAVLPK